MDSATQEVKYIFLKTMSCGAFWLNVLISPLTLILLIMSTGDPRGKSILEAVVKFITFFYGVQILAILPFALLDKLASN